MLSSLLKLLLTYYFPNFYTKENLPQTTLTQNERECIIPFTFFICLIQRFGDSKKDTPAPGTYNDPRNSLEILKRYAQVFHND